jgi:beta-glucosidase
LSYTLYELSDLDVEYGDTIKASVQVANLGGRSGSLAVQCYVTKLGEGGFVRVDLSAGQRRIATLELEPRVFARYQEKEGCFQIAEGVYRVWAAQHAEAEDTWKDIVVRSASRIAP